MLNTPHPHQHLIDQLVQKTFDEIEATEKPKNRSRISNTSNGYIFLVSWSNANLLRVLLTKWFNWYRSDILQTPSDSFNNPPTSFKGIYRNLEEYPKINPRLFSRLEAQVLDAIRSVVANHEEGFGRPTTKEYLQFLGYAEGSLLEVKGDLQRMEQDGLLPKQQDSSVTELGINLKDWHEALKKSSVSRTPSKNTREYYENKSSSKKSSKILQTPLKECKGNYRSGHTFNFPPVDTFQPQDLTYNQCLELCNKTNWHIRKLVNSLENKLHDDKKYYQVEQARINHRAGRRPR